MPFHDLNVLYKSDHTDVSSIIPFHHELGYNVVALNHLVSGQLPNPLPQISASDRVKSTIPQLKVLSRLTLTISDTSQNHRINTLQNTYDLIALRPTSEKTLQLCCSSLECDLISIDFSQRLSYPIKFKTVSLALQRGIRFEICYGPGISNGNDARRNLISGATTLIRATRSRGIIISSEAKNALAVRAPWDAINLVQVWGLNQEKGKEAVCEEAGKVVKFAALKRTSYRGVVDIIEGSSLDNKNNNITTTAPATASTIVTAPSTTSKDQKLANKQQVKKPNGQGVSETSTTSKETITTTSTKRKASTTSLTNSPSLLPSPPPASSKPDQTPTIDQTKPPSKKELKRRAKKARLEDRNGGQKQDPKSGDVSLPRVSFPVQHESLKK